MLVSARSTVVDAQQEDKRAKTSQKHKKRKNVTPSPRSCLPLSLPSPFCRLFFTHKTRWFHGIVLGAILPHIYAQAYASFLSCMGGEHARNQHTIRVGPALPHTRGPLELLMNFHRRAVPLQSFLPTYQYDGTRDCFCLTADWTAARVRALSQLLLVRVPGSMGASVVLPGYHPSPQNAHLATLARDEPHNIILRWRVVLKVQTSAGLPDDMSLVPRDRLARQRQTLTVDMLQAAITDVGQGVSGNAMRSLTDFRLLTAQDSEAHLVRERRRS